jgi:nicotinamidase-related amidase
LGEVVVAKTALLLMDLQNAIVNMIGCDPSSIARLQQAKAAARKAEMLVVYVVVKFRPKFPEVSPRNKVFAALKSGAMPFLESESAMEIHNDLVPEPSDIVVTKRRVSGFAGSDLEVVLRAQGIEHIVLAGISTSGVVLSTLREAADKDYEITVLSDCCFDRDEEVHRVLTEKVFAMQSNVLKLNEWSASISR